jgi:hypothetical protein
MSLPPALPKRKRKPLRKLGASWSHETSVKQQATPTPSDSSERSHVMPLDESTSATHVPTPFASKPTFQLPKNAVHTHHSVTSVSTSCIESSLKRTFEFMNDSMSDYPNAENGISTATSDDAYVTSEAVDDDLYFAHDDLFEGAKDSMTGLSKKRQKKNKESKVCFRASVILITG